jgi:hypothetical protein
LTFPASTILSTVVLTHRIFAIVIAVSIRAASFAPIDQGATSAIAALVFIVVVVVVFVVVLVVVVIAAGDEE